MKKIIFLIALLLCIMCLSGCGNNEMKNDSMSIPSMPDADQPQSSNVADQDSSTIDIDASNLVKVDVPGFLPINTASIRDILNDTGRFTYNRLILEGGGVDVYFELDKPDRKDAVGASRIFYQVLSENMTEIISYNFAKLEVNGDEHDTIKWGLNMLLHIFGTELTDDTWADILKIAAKSEAVDALGTD